MQETPQTPQEEIPPTVGEVEVPSPAPVAAEANSEIDLDAEFAGTQAKPAPEAPVQKPEPAVEKIKIEEELPALAAIAAAGAAEGFADEEQLEINAPNAVHVESCRLPDESGSPDTIEIPPSSWEDLKKKLAILPNIGLTTSRGQVRWGGVLNDSVSYLPRRDMFMGSLKRPNSEWVQRMDVNGQKVQATAPTFKRRPGVHEIEGERAVLEITTHLGIGGLFRTPLYHSGLWVTFKPAMNDDFVELNRLIFADKINYGRWTYGLVFSNSTVYTMDRVFEFALRHVFNTSVKAEELPLTSLREYIAPQDIFTFIWGFLCACYPSGFHYETPCINSPNKCNHVIHETLNLTKLQNVDETALTVWQKQHMAGMAANSKSLESIKRYREELACLADRVVTLNKDTKYAIRITIKTPTITQYVEKGYRWISGMVDSVNSALTLDSPIAERNAEINRLGKATALCQYAHFIDKIEYGDLEDGDTGAEASISVASDSETIDQMLRSLSGTDSIREAIIEEVLKYINDSTISIIGVPAFDCPVCHEPQEGKATFPRQTSVIPLDLLQVFFGLFNQRLGRIDQE